MGKTDNEGKQPKNVLVHPSSFSDFMKLQMGMINSNDMYNNHFLQLSEVWKFLEHVREAISQGTIDVKNHPELKLNAEAFEKINKIYNGGCYLVRKSEIDLDAKWEFVYEYPEGVNPESIQKLPALKDMNPTKTIDSDDWGIVIRTQVPIKYAFAGYSYATVIHEGKFYDMTPEGMVPRFEPQEMHSNQFETHTVSRNYFNNTVEILMKRFHKNWNILFVNLIKILEHLENATPAFADEKSELKPEELGSG